MSELTELLERVKAATGPDRTTERRLDSVLRPVRDGEEEWSSPLLVDIPKYTSSLDAALSLVERMLPEHRFAFYTDGQGKGPCCLVMIGDEPVVAQEFGKTLPLAILAALLSALLAKE